MDRSTPPPEIVAVAAALLPRTAELGERLAQRMRERIESYTNEDLVPFATVQASCTRNLELMLRHFAHEGPADVGPPMETGRLRAEQGVPLPDTLHAYRIGFEFLWEVMVAEARAHTRVTDAMLVSIAGEVWWLAGEYSNAVAEAYREMTADLLLQREHERSALVEALFTGNIGDGTTVAEAGRTLGLPAAGPYVVVAARAPSTGREALPGIEAALRSRRVRSAWRLLPEQQLGLVALGSSGDDRAVLALLREYPARVGVSPEFGSLRDTAPSLRYARLALAGLPEDGPGVARFEDNPLAALIAAAPEEASHMARDVLGPVLRLPAAERARLLATLERWFAAGGAVPEAAERLYVHPNTVRYRIRQVESLLGRSLRDPGVLRDVGAALLAVRHETGDPAGETRGVVRPPGT